MTSDEANGVLSLADPKSRFTFTFTISPFFANAMQYGTKNAGEALAQELTVLAEDGSVATGTEALPMPGEEGRQYEIRSAEQLEYLNWNSKTGDAITTLEENNYLKNVNYYTYLGQMLGENPSKADGAGATDGKISVQQTHDVDANMEPGGEKLFTQIGSLYDINAKDTKTGDAKAYIAYFTGKYNGNSFFIKNIAQC